MRIDLYTKTILTLITLLLAAILLRPNVHPQVTIAQGNPGAQENLSSIQFSAAVGGFYAFDTSTGDIWAYNLASGGCAHFKLTKLKQPAKDAVIVGYTGREGLDWRNIKLPRKFGKTGATLRRTNQEPPSSPRPRP